MSETAVNKQLKQSSLCFMETFIQQILTGNNINKSRATSIDIHVV